MQLQFLFYHFVSSTNSNRLKTYFYEEKTLFNSDLISDKFSRNLISFYKPSEMMLKYNEHKELFRSVKPVGLESLKLTQLTKSEIDKLTLGQKLVLATPYNQGLNWLDNPSCLQINNIVFAMSFQHSIFSSSSAKIYDAFFVQQNIDLFLNESYFYSLIV